MTAKSRMIGTFAITSITLSHGDALGRRRPDTYLVLRCALGGDGQKAS